MNKFTNSWPNATSINSQRTSGFPTLAEKTISKKLRTELANKIKVNQTPGKKPAASLLLVSLGSGIGASELY